MLRTWHPLTGWMIFYICLRVSEYEASSRLKDSDPYGMFSRELLLLLFHPFPSTRLWMIVNGMEV